MRRSEILNGKDCGIDNVNVGDTVTVNIEINGVTVVVICLLEPGPSASENTG